MDNDIVLTDGIPINDDRSEAVEALTSLGYTRSEAVKAVSKVYNDGMDVQKILSSALKELSRL